MKPKENTIAKIDDLYKSLSRSPPPSLDIALAGALQQRCHTMNIHKAKVVYFKRIKLVLTRALELARAEHNSGNPPPDNEYRQLEREMRALLDANNG